MNTRLNALLAHLSPAWFKVVTDILYYRGEDALHATPASCKTHQSYPGGLVEHLTETADLALAMAALPPYRNVDRQLLVAMALVHDIGKVDSYAPNLDTQTYEYTDVDRQLHHIGAGLLILGECRAIHRPSWTDHGLYDQSQLLAHAIVSHHGYPEWKSMRSPATLEAAMVHYADYASAGLGSFQANIPWRRA